MKHTGWVTAALVAGTVFFHSTANADDIKDCARTGENAVTACTRIIESGKFRGKDLAFVYMLRAAAYKAAGDRQRTISDMDDFVRLSGDRAGALHSRGEEFTTYG